jgi:hypothetical protein
MMVLEEWRDYRLCNPTNIENAGVPLEMPLWSCVPRISLPPTTTPCSESVMPTPRRLASGSTLLDSPYSIRCQGTCYCMCIQNNVRASRSFPLYSPRPWELISLRLPPDPGDGWIRYFRSWTCPLLTLIIGIPFVAQRLPVFSFTRLRADLIEPVLSVIMASTGGVAYFGATTREELELPPRLSSSLSGSRPLYSFELPRRAFLFLSRELFGQAHSLRTPSLTLTCLLYHNRILKLYCE